MCMILHSQQVKRELMSRMKRVIPILLKGRHGKAPDLEVDEAGVSPEMVAVG